MSEGSSHTTAISSELHLKPTQVASTIALFAEGCTLPFIARYRKEATGGLDEVQIAAIRDAHQLRLEIGKRREAILASLSKQDVLTTALQTALQAARTMTELEDIYLPHRPKRRTRATIAKEKGLLPLAEALYRRPATPFSLTDFCQSLSIACMTAEALAGARDIIAEQISEDPASRSGLRDIFRSQAILHAKVIDKKEEEASKYRDYFAWQEPITKISGHRLLAILRGENENFLSVSLRPTPDIALRFLQRSHLSATTGNREEIIMAVEDAYKRLLAPSLESEVRRERKDQADREAIAVFAANLQELLLAPPLGQRRVLALDPGFRTGAKLVCLDEQGNLRHNTTVYPTQSAAQQEIAATTIRRLVEQFAIEAIAIGNGTASRETEAFVRALDLPAEIIITLVNEDGASIYSASEIARREFPDHDLTVRGAISIGRRLQDPLAELVKIDPKAIGVGQYQHDVQQSALKQALDDVVAYCVNRVGVEVNSASLELLTAVSGLGPVLAANIITHRLNNGPFTSRQDLRQVPRLGAKAFEQCAGFLRVSASANPLDRSAVHPERYSLVTQMAKDCGVSLAELLHSTAIQAKIDLGRYVTADVGLPTLEDIRSELAKPGRDPRRNFSQFTFAPGIQTIDDLQVGMKLPAIITNVTKFGAFADIGVHQDGLIHISQLADRFVKDPADVVKVRQQVEVRVLTVDKERRRIALSLRHD